MDRARTVDRPRWRCRNRAVAMAIVRGWTAPVNALDVSINESGELQGGSGGLRKLISVLHVFPPGQSNSFAAYK